MTEEKVNKFIKDNFPGCTIPQRIIIRENIDYEWKKTKHLYLDEDEYFTEQSENKDLHEFFLI